MSNIIPLKQPLRKKEAKLLTVSDELDAVILKYLADPLVTQRELTGLVAHRLGALLKLAEDKDELWNICQRIAKEQGHLK